MANPNVVREPAERAYSRFGMFAIEVRDAVSLERLTTGIDVKAVGLRGRRVVNHGGLFVWLQEDRTGLVKVTVDPGALPFMSEERLPAAIMNGVNVVELNPRAGYPFAVGTTGVRGMLIESPVPPSLLRPVAAATLRLEWLDIDGVTWRADSGRFRTDARGEFAAFLRFRATDEPLVAPDGSLKLRVFARRGAGPEKRDESSYPQGRVRERTLAWDQLQ